MSTYMGNPMSCHFNSSAANPASQIMYVVLCLFVYIYMYMYTHMCGVPYIFINT